jgi:hypothetical protein
VSGALYVYGVVPAATSPDLFSQVQGVDASAPVVLVADDGLAAIASPVKLEEFGQDALERNIHEPAWLEEKVIAHDRVLEAAVGRTTVVPFRFGAVYTGEEHVRRMLDERPDLTAAMSRLDGTVELGVKAYLVRPTGDETEAPTSGREYMERKRRERSEAERASTRRLRTRGRMPSTIRSSTARTA